MLELILVIGYIIVTTAIGWILSTRAKARNDINSFFVGKKELSAVLVCFIMFGDRRQKRTQRSPRLLHHVR